METFFKVLVNGKSCNGGNFQWSLPRQNADGSWQAGDWHEHKGDLRISAEEFLLTRTPGRLMLGGETVECYATEYEGALKEYGKWLLRKDEKIVCGRVRLTRKLTDLELAAYNVFRSAELIPRQISGDLDLRCTAIKVLPVGLQVGGSLDVSYAGIEVLPEGLQVGGDLYLGGTGITVLPAGLQVGGDLDLSSTGIKVLPEGLQVGGDLDLRFTDITVLPEGLSVGSCVYLNGLNGGQLRVGKFTIKCR